MWIDFIAGIVFLLFVVVGMITGGVAQLLRLSAAIAAFYFAPVISDVIRPLIGGLFVDINLLLLEGLSLVTAVVSVYLLASLIIRMTVEQLIDESAVLGAFDGLVGALVGGLKGALLIIVIGHALYLMTSILPPSEVEKSLLLDTIHTIRMDRFLDLSHLGKEMFEWFHPEAALDPH